MINVHHDDKMTKNNFYTAFAKSKIFFNIFFIFLSRGKHRRADKMQHISVKNNKSKSNLNFFMAIV